MTDNSHSLRTPLSKARGLGASGGGTDHFWLQRVTAIANVPLAIIFIFIVIALSGAHYQLAGAIVSHPLVAILLMLFIVSGLVHMRIGMQVIIEDYVHSKGLKFAALMLNTFFTIAVGVASLFALMRIAFSAL
jgi:succinate dehydrogenase / fumarate reductase, membrane anchor subunit